MPPEGEGEREIMPPEGEGERGGGRDELELILMLTWMTYKLGNQSNHNSQSQKRIYYKKAERTQI